MRCQGFDEYDAQAPTCENQATHRVRVKTDEGQRDVWLCDYCYRRFTEDIGVGIRFPRHHK